MDTIGEVKGGRLCHIAVCQHHRVDLGQERLGEGFEFIQRDFPGGLKLLFCTPGALDQQALNAFRGLLHRPFLGLV